MMGKSHAASGAAAWLAGCAAPAVADNPTIGGWVARVDPLAGQILAQLSVWFDPVGWEVIVVGTFLAAYGALVPDIDHPESTVSRSLGPISHLFAKGFAAGCARLHEATKTRADRTDRDGHRTGSHTTVFAVLFGGGLVPLAWWGGQRAALAIIFIAAATAISALLPPKRRRIRVRARWLFGDRRRRRLLPTGPTVAAALTLLVWWKATPSGAWIGTAIAVGCLMHCLGDSLTKDGCPLFWPIRIAGRRWYPVRFPEGWRMTTGKGLEPVVQLGCALVFIAAGSLLLWPWVASVAASIAAVL
jgi:membrane-bound metal-dependent hydrolase YbcI (DUF457 family)